MVVFEFSALLRKNCERAGEPRRSDGRRSRESGWDTMGMASWRSKKEANINQNSSQSLSLETFFSPPDVILRRSAAEFLSSWNNLLEA